MAKILFKYQVSMLWKYLENSIKIMYVYRYIYEKFIDLETTLAWFFLLYIMYFKF